MSAAQPAEPTPPTVVNTSGDAAVINISDKLGKKTRRSSAGRRWDTMGDTDPEPGPTREPHVQGDPLRQLAESFEKSFNARGLSLTDDDTAAAYAVTLDLVEKALEGAEAQDIIDPEQRQELTVLLGGMKAAPGLV